MQTRRNFLATLGVAAVGIATHDKAAASELFSSHRKRKRIGLQLYTVRGLMKAELRSIQDGGGASRHRTR